MNTLRLRFTVVLLFCVAFRGYSEFIGNDMVLLLHKSDDIQSMNALIEEVEYLGGKIIHIYPPHVLIGHLQAGNETKISSEKAQCFRGELDPREAREYGEVFVAAVDAWNNNYQGKARIRGLDPAPEDRKSVSLSDDVLPIPAEVRGRKVDGDDPVARPQGAGYYDVSEFFIGKVSVNVILTESDGTIDPQTENWSSTREQQVVSEIQAGLGWHASQESRANISFVYHFYYGRTDTRARTGYEPINKSSTQDGLWITEILGKFSFTGADKFARSFAALNSWIVADDADWGLLMFVVDSDVDGDGMFTDSKFAYTYLGGPYLVMTYDNEEYTIGRMDEVTVHETSHDFHALDEYTSNQPCTMRSGYLNIENRNSDYGGCLLFLPCVMNSGLLSEGLCSYSREMVGWRDVDGDNVLDVADTYPVTTLNQLNPNPTYDKTPTFTGSGFDGALTNLNPYPFGHSGPANDISPNTITEFWWRVNAGNWNIYPAAFTSFTTDVLPNGPHIFELKCKNSLNRFDQTPELQSFTESGHLHSSMVSVTGSNNQKTVARDASGNYHLVYADENIVYYSSSTDGGSTWSTEEQLLSSYGLSSSYPSIATDDNFVFVVWQGYAGLVQGEHEYHIEGAWKGPGYDWSEIINYDPETYPLIARFLTQTDPLPVIVAADNSADEIYPWTTNPELMVAWRNGDGCIGPN